MQTRTGGGASRRRPLVLLSALLVLVVVVFLGGGGWYFANQIRQDGLSRQPPSHEDDLTVTQVGDGAIGLREAAGAHTDALHKTYVYGLQWPGGSGVVAAAVSPGPKGSVLRPLAVKVGTPPRVGMTAVLNPQVYVDPTSAYGVRVEQVRYPCAASNVSCPAWFVNGRGSTWAVLVHGKGSTRTEPLRALGAALRVALPSMVITYRNDVDAPADPSRFYRYGATEWRDLESAVRFAQQRGARHVVLFGFSMGGGIVASFLEHSAAAGLVSGVVLDAPMLNFRRTVDFAASRRQLPLIGLPLPRPLTWTAETLAGLRFGIDWRSIDYLDGRWLRVPALVFHGTVDDTVPISTSDALARGHRQLVQEVRVAGASHVEAWNANPAAYTDTVVTFLHKVRVG